MDRDVYAAPYFACHPCDNTQSIKFKTEDLLNVLLPKIGHEPIIVELIRQKAKKGSENALRNLLYEFVYCKPYQLVSLCI